MESKRSESIMNLAAALAVAQGQIKTASKDNTAEVKMTSGGKFTYKYSTLDDIWNACRKPLSDNGLSVVQIPINDKEGFYLETILLHSSGEWMSGTLTLPIVADRMSQLQAMGSTITYARRYMLGAMVGVTTGDDDDGRASSTLETGPKNKQKNNGMTLDKLLANLDRVERIRGFYSPSSIMACRPKSAELPSPDDTEGWRQLFVDARNHAFEQLDQAAGDNISPDQAPLTQGFGQVEPGEGFSTEPMPEAEAVQTSMGEIETDNADQIPF